MQIYYNIVCQDPKCSYKARFNPRMAIGEAQWHADWKGHEVSVLDEETGDAELVSPRDLD